MMYLFFQNLLWISVVCVGGLSIGVIVGTRITNKNNNKGNTKIYQVSGIVDRSDRFLYYTIVVTVSRIFFFTTLITFRLVEFSQFSLLSTTPLLLGIFVWTELWFYTTHRLMHTKYLFWIHKAHHIAVVPQGLSGVTFGFWENLVIMIGNAIPFIVASSLDALSIYPFILFLLLRDTSNILDHLNLDLQKPNYYKTFWKWIFNSPTYHAIHHARFNGNYGQSTPWFDTLFKTKHEDTEKIFDRVKSGHPLTKLRERG